MSTESRPAHALAGRSVLIIEDDPVMLHNLAQWLRQAGCRTLLAQNGVEGVAQFSKMRPDAVVTDILMPDREGIETLMTIKDQAPEVKVLLISGGGRLGSTDLLSMALGLGANAVLAKPFRSADVVEAVARMMRSGEG